MTFMEIEPEDIYTFERKVLVDIRSPQEYKEFHIPKAINIPLFDDEEKKLIGMLYRQEGEQKAKAEGYSIASKKIEKLFAKFRSLKEEYKEVIIYCWRGGLRSQELCYVLDRAGIDVMRLKGGYRAYRQFILSDMEKRLKEMNFLVLTGKTGVGKSKILSLLKRKGIPVIDVEKLAKDRGSVFGKVGRRERVSQKMFDALLYEEIRGLNSSLVFMEDESRWVGNIHLPEALWKRKEMGIFIEIRTDIELRIKNILDEYTKEEGWKEDVISSLKKVRKYMGEENYKRVLNLLTAGDYEKAAELLIQEYYDRRYKYGGRPKIILEYKSMDEVVEELMDIYRGISESLSALNV